MTDDLHDRQRRLPEIGAQGQARIEAALARLPAGPSATVALSYLVRAGVGRLRIDRTEPERSQHAAHFRFTHPLAVAEGAHQAQRVLLDAVRPSGGVP